jgi:hypothetical protein
MKQVQDVKWYQRLKIIDLSAQGFTVTDLSQMFDLNAGTIGATSTLTTKRNWTGCAPATVKADH